MIFNKNVKYKCKNARVVKCVSNEMVCHVVEFKKNKIWVPYKVTGELSDAINVIILTYKNYLIKQYDEYDKNKED